MHEVTTLGTASLIPKIPGVNICAKTGTAENKKVLDGKVIQLKDHSLFTCFAPMEDPKIAVAVIVENGGFGATWAGPMAYLMVEKFLTDSLRADRKTEADRISAANLMPSYLPRLQFKEDSVRARFYFNLTKDSAYIKKYLHKANILPIDTLPSKQRIVKKTFDIINPKEEITFIKKKNTLAR
jgi:penicillin-binding protein 2